MAAKDGKDKEAEDGGNAERLQDELFLSTPFVAEKLKRRMYSDFGVPLASLP